MADLTLQKDLWAALGAGDCLRVCDLVAAGADVNAPIGNPGGETPLIRAITGDKLELVQTLLRTGADVNLRWKGPKSWTPLMFAHQNAGILAELISAGADVNACDTGDWISSPSGGHVRRPGGETALHLAAAAGNAASVLTLLRARANAEAKTDDGLGPLDYAIGRGASNEAAELLVQAGAELTPQRLDVMYSAAHNPDADFFAVLVAGVPGASGSRVERPAPATSHDKAHPPTFHETAGAQAEARCPDCHAVLDSRKAKLCGQCGAPLPLEMILTDQQAQARDGERDWARELADKFSNPPSSNRRSDSSAPAGPALGGSPTEAIFPKELLQQVSCVEEFRHRARPAFWVYLVGYGFMLFVFGFLAISVNVFPPASLLALIALIGFFCLRAWQQASPICPRCKLNIRLCTETHCHVCGKPLRYGRCEECQVDRSWKGNLLPYSNQGNYRWLTYCPGCGARVEARFRRARMGSY